MVKRLNINDSGPGETQYDDVRNLHGTFLDSI